MGFNWMPRSTPHRADWRVVADTWTDGPAQLTEPRLKRAFPRVAAVHEQDSAQLAVNAEPRLGGDLQHRAPADGLPCGRQRAHLVASPSADAAGTADKIAFVERNRRRARSCQCCRAQPIRPDEARSNRHVPTHLAVELGEIERAAEPTARPSGRVHSPRIPGADRAAAPPYCVRNQIREP